MAENNKSCSDERLAEILLKEGNIDAFNREYWHPELRKYEERHEAVMDSLRRGTRHHLKGNFSDTQFNATIPEMVNTSEHVVDNMWFNCFDCTHHQKSEELYNMFKDEVFRHVKDNILPELKRIEPMNLFKQLAASWVIFNKTISVFSELFPHLTLWIEDVPEDETPMDGIENIGLNAFKNEIVLEEDIFLKLKSILITRSEERRKGIDVDIKAIFNFLVEMNCYEKVFKEHFESHFEKVASENLKTMSAHEYAKQVKILIANEIESNRVYGNAALTE